MKQRKREPFTEQQRKELLKNQFTDNVTTHTITFTLDFKNIFYARYEKGERAIDIFADLGYDPYMLGESRINNFTYKLTQKLKNGLLFSDATSDNKNELPPKVIDYNMLPSQQSFTALQREVIYLRQQLEFLKKILLTGKEKQ